MILAGDTKSIGMQMKARYLLFLVPLCVANLAFAEGGCPSGMIPYSGADIATCGPVPAGYYENENSSRQTVRAPERWEDRWGAIAFSKGDSAVGVAAEMTSETRANEAAINDCVGAGGKACWIALTYYNQCGVVAWGKGLSTTARALTVSKASAIAMEECNEEAADCKIVYSDCSLPKRVR